MSTQHLESTFPAGTTDPSRAARRRPRTWAWSGVAAGVLGMATIQASMLSSVNWDLTAGDAEAMLADASGKQPAYLAFHLLAVLTLLALVVFGAGLKRRLDDRGPEGSLHGQIALGGLVLTAVALMLGSGLDTQFGLGLSDPSAYVPESAAFYTDWVATIPWVWVGSGLSAMAVAHAALRHRAVPRSLGMVSLVFGLLILLTGASPLQYLAGFIGPVWVLIVALGFALGDRR
ncbi:hypothetical protein FCK90_13135 [Kocuria coralli]|uniref:DUF4386 family protein n=1 Tax=Kocuria coralli TaxID=1461025 RepID=A0A5J5KUN3_9MICC|nr:hypothetical protein [Kocuria coralli]KAA9393222.1 hypothetical protein FCK90_13135 [Kocuria coralli]